MKVEVLVSTMKKKDISFLKKMNLSTDVIVGNQDGRFDNETFKLNDKIVRMITTNTKGLSNNRNVTLSHATADICLIADDDLTYENDYAEKVVEVFKNNPNSDVVIFNIFEKKPTRYVIRKKMKVGFFNYMRFGSVRIAFKLKSILDKKISFDPFFGSGSNVSFGEDTIFLHDCLKAKLKIIAVPITILSLTDERPSTWFKGFDEKYFSDKGKLFKRLNKKWHAFLCFQDAVRHRKEYGLPWRKVYKLERKLK